MVDGSLATVTVPVADRFGWTKLNAVEWKRVSRIVNITTGALATAHTAKTSQSLASRVLASCLIYSYAHIEYINRFAVDRISQLTNLCKSLTPPISGIHRIYMWVRSVSICYRP